MKLDGNLTVVEVGRILKNKRWRRNRNERRAWILIEEEETERGLSSPVMLSVKRKRQRRDGAWVLVDRSWCGRSSGERRRRGGAGRRLGEAEDPESSPTEEKKVEEKERRGGGAISVREKGYSWDKRSGREMASWRSMTSGGDARRWEIRKQIRRKKEKMREIRKLWNGRELL